jgi:hypothetical protein
VVGIGVGADEVVGELFRAGVVPESALVLDAIEAIRVAVWELPVE